MTSLIRWRCCVSRITIGTSRSIGAAAGATWIAIAIAGCGIGGSSGTPDAASAEEAQTGEAASGGATASPGIMVTPAAGGGVVVGDPLDAGAGRAAPPARDDEELPPDRAGRVVEDKGGDPPAVAATTPAPQARPGQFVGDARADRYEDDGPVNDAPLANQAATQVADPGDEPPPRVGALAEDKGGFANPPLGFSNREQAEADAARNRPGAVVGEEDVDAPPAAARAGAANPVGPNAALEGRVGRFEDGDEGFPRGGGGGAGIQPAGSIEIKRGSADEVATTFLSLIAAGDLERAKPLIAGRATGLLAKLRDGTATPEQINELTAAAAARQQENSRSKGGTLKLITYRADKKMLLLEADQKEDADCSVVKLDIRNAPRRRSN